jgi:hypothetical protein
MPLTEIQKAVIDDVRAQLATGCLVPLVNRFGGYQRRGADFRRDDLEDRPKEGDTCHACALGSLLISVTKIREGGRLPSFAGQGRWGIMGRLDDVFSRRTLNLMEAAFERSSSYYEQEVVTERDVRKAIRFGEKYLAPLDCLLAILKNIEMNEGEFTP